MGTTLVREEPITWALHPERHPTHCQECLALVRCVIPCRTCSAVTFCSVACRDKAGASYHRYECSMTAILTASGLNIYPALTLRLLTRFGAEHIWGMRERLESPDDTVGASTDTEYRADDFINAFNLVCHEDKLTDEENLLRYRDRRQSRIIITFQDSGLCVST